MHVLFFPLSDRELVVEICFGDCLCTLWPHTLLGAQLFILPLHFREETSKVIHIGQGELYICSDKPVKALQEQRY